MHICISKLTIIGSDNGLSPWRRQAIIWTNAWILLIGPLGTNFIEIFITIYTFSLKKMHVKMLSGKWQPFCLRLNVLMICYYLEDTSGILSHTGTCRMSLSQQIRTGLVRRLTQLILSCSWSWWQTFLLGIWVTRLWDIWHQISQRFSIVR